jgi:hypothetical protein
MNEEQVKTRLDEAMQRGHGATEEELSEVAAVVFDIVGEVPLELAVLIADLADRVAALESKG